MNTFTYKGYTGRCEVDAEAGVIHGRVLDIVDVITFESDCVAGARREFEASIDDYLAWCNERGKEPARPFSGKFLFRTTPERHRQIHLAAARAGKSINAWLEDVVSATLECQAGPRPTEVADVEPAAPRA